MMNNIVILGAGIAGLGAAYKLRHANQASVILEKDDTYGGLIGIETIDRFGEWVENY